MKFRFALVLAVLLFTAALRAERALVANAKSVRRLMLATGRERAPHWPDIVQIESTNLCNAKCVFCPRDEMHRRQGISQREKTERGELPRGRKIGR